MKKLMFALLAVGLIALAIIPAACDKGTDPGAFSSYSLQGVTFSHPIAWIDQTTETEQSMAEKEPNYSEYMEVAAWANPADFSLLFAMSIDFQELGMPKNYTMTESDKESFVSGVTGYMPTAMEKSTIVSQGKTTINGQWAWQIEFSGDIKNVSAKGYMLTVISNDTVFMFMCTGQSSGWNSLKSTCDVVKASIVFN